MAKPMSTSVHSRDFLSVFCCCLPVSFGCGCVAQISWKAEGKLPSFATSETIVRIFSRDSRCRSKRLRGRWYTGPIVNWFRPTEKPSMEDKSTPTRNWYKLPQKSRYGFNWAKYTLTRIKKFWGFQWQSTHFSVFPWACSSAIAFTTTKFMYNYKLKL